MDCSHLMTVLRILMMLIVSIVAVVLQELDLGTVSVSLAVYAAAQIAVVIHSTFAAFAFSELPVLYPIRPPRTQKVIDQ